ncbi:MAG: DUF2752 domain-containing protein [Bacilli bacterium]|nr:DUF2752 domain-containing protein [Bacilli bacterium]
MKEKIISLILPPIKVISKYKYIFFFIFLYVSYFFIFHYGETNCIIKRTFGIPCPGCGMTRALIYLVSFDFKNAFFYHPLVFMMPFIIIVFLYQDTKLFWNLAHSKIAIGMIIALFIIVYIVRMILYFPDTQPMDYFHNPTILKLLWK